MPVSQSKHSLPFAATPAPFAQNLPAGSAAVRPTVMKDEQLERQERVRIRQ